MSAKNRRNQSANLADEHKDEKVRDHCRIPGKYRGTVLVIRSLSTTQSFSSFPSIVFLNLSNSDAQLFVTEVIEQKYKSLSFGFVTKNDEKKISQLHMDHMDWAFHRFIQFHENL